MDNFCEDKKSKGFFFGPPILWGLGGLSTIHKNV
jgi:hypothetical protein